MSTKAGIGNLWEFAHPRAKTNGQLTTDELFSILANRRRRFTLHYLLQHERVCELREIAEQVAAWENETTIRDLTADSRKQVYTALQQNHLPKMDNMGVIEFNKERGTITPTPTLDELEVYLDIVTGHEIPWSEYYIALSAVSVALLTAVWTVGFPFTLLPDIAWGLVVSIGFAISSIAHVYDNRRRKLGAAEAPPEIERVS